MVQRRRIVQHVRVHRHHTGTAAGRPDRHRAARARRLRQQQRIADDAGETRRRRSRAVHHVAMTDVAAMPAAQQWRHRVHGGRGRIDAERIGSGCEQRGMSAGRRWRGKRARRGDRMLLHLQGADDDRLAIVVSDWRGTPRRVRRKQRRQ